MVSEAGNAVGIHHAVDADAGFAERTVVAAGALVVVQYVFGAVNGDDREAFTLVHAGKDGADAEVVVFKKMRCYAK